MKTFNGVLYVFVLIGILVVAHYFDELLTELETCQARLADCQAELATVRSHIPTYEELQKKLGVEPDGKIGKETMAAWEKAFQKEGK